MRKVIQALAAAAALSFAYPSEAAVLVFNGNEVTGATGIVVGGLSYDVTFTDGTCVALFDGCDESTDFQFVSSEAMDAAFLLIDLLYRNNPRASPNLIYGCEDAISSCTISIPYQFFQKVNSFDVRYMFPTGSVYNTGRLLDGIDEDADTSSLPGRVYALFTPSNASAVPEPSTWMTMLLGFVLVGFATRRPRTRSVNQIA